MTTTFESSHMTREKLARLVAKQHVNVSAENSSEQKFCAIVAVCLSLGNLWMTRQIEMSGKLFNTLGLICNILSSIGFILICYRVLTYDVTKFVTLKDLKRDGKSECTDGYLRSFESREEKRKQEYVLPSNPTSLANRQDVVAHTEAIQRKLVAKPTHSFDEDGVWSRTKRRINHVERTGIQMDLDKFLDETKQQTYPPRKQKNLFINFLRLEHLWSSRTYLSSISTPILLCLISLRLSYIEYFGMNENNLFELVFPAVVLIYGVITEYIMQIMNDRVNDVNFMYALLYDLMEAQKK